MIRPLPRVIGQVWIVLFLVFFGAEVIHLEPSLRMLTQVMYGVPLAVGAALMLRGPVDRLDVAVLVGLGVYATVAFLSRDLTESLGTLGLVTAYAAWFVMVRRLRQPARDSLIVAAATGLAITLAINAYLLIEEKVALINRFGGAPFEGRNTFPWESVNALPILVLVAIPFLAWLAPGPGRTLLRGVVGASALIVVPLSLGRAGWLALGVVAFVVVLAWAWERFNGARPAVVGVSAFIVLLGTVLAMPRLMTGLADSARLLLWEQGLRLAERSPLVGSGPGVYSWVRLEVPPDTADLVAVRLLHNVPLQTLVDGGVVLLLGLLVPVVTWIVSVWRRRSWRGADGVAIVVLAGYGASTVLDDFSYLPAVTASIVTIAGLLVPMSSDERRRSPAVLALPAALALAAVVSLPGVIGVDIARVASQSGRAAMVNGYYSEAASDFAAATEAHSQSGAYWLGLGMAHAWAGESVGAAAAYRRATEVAPGDPRPYAALASLRTTGATSLLGSAAARTTGDPRYSALLGEALAASGDMDGALHAWAAAVALWPDYVGVPPLDDVGIDRAAVVAEARATIAAGLHPGPMENLVALWDLGLASGDLSPAAGAPWLAVEAARSGDRAAAAAFAEAAVAEEPWAARGYQARAAVAAFACLPADEASALAQEAFARGAHVRAVEEPAARREFIYREASLGPTQPPGALPALPDEMWPWGLIERPECP